MTTRLFVASLLAVVSVCLASLSFAAPKATPTPAPSSTPKASPTPPPATPSPTPTPASTPASTPTPATARCPLPIDYLVTSTSGTSTTSNTNSPEKGPGPLKALCHKPNGQPNIILCLPPNAYNAHSQHGDTPVSFTCTKEGNQGPCN